MFATSRVMLGLLCAILAASSTSGLAKSPALSVSVKTRDNAPYFATFDTSNTAFHWEAGVMQTHHEDHAGEEEPELLDDFGLEDEELQRVMRLDPNRFPERKEVKILNDGQNGQRILNGGLKYFVEAKPQDIAVYLRYKLPFFVVALCECDRDEELLKAVWDFDQILDKSENFFVARSITYLYARSHAIEKFQLKKVFKLASGDLPAVLIDNIPVGANLEKFRLEQLMSASRKEGQHITGSIIEQFVREFKAGSLPLVIRSAPVPKTQKENAPVEVVASEFNRIVLQSKKNVFLFVYSPKCPACVAADAVVQQLAHEVHDNPSRYPNILIARMDGSSNDFPVRGIPLKHFPSGFLFPSQEFSEGQWVSFLNWDDFNGFNAPHSHNSQHSHYQLESLQQFLLEHSTR